MSAQLEQVEEQGTLFSPKPFVATRTGMGLRSAGNLPIGEEEHALLAAADDTEQVIEIKAWANVKGYTKDHGTLTWNLAVIDAQVVQD